MSEKKFDVRTIVEKANKAAANKAKMEALLKEMTPDSREAAKKYISQKEIPQLFESITAGMLHHRPENPVEFVQECLDIVGKSKSTPHWDAFINFEPSEKAMRPSSRPNSSSQKSSRPTTQQSANTSNNASYTPAPISAHPANKGRASAKNSIESFP